MVYTLGLDLGGGPATAAIGRPEAGARHEWGAVHAVGTAVVVDALLDRLGAPPTARWTEDGTDARSGLVALVAAATAAAARAEGDGPSALVVAHPSTWGAYRVGLLVAALREHGEAAEVLPAAVAVAAYHEDQHAADHDGVVAVLDVRHEHLDVSVVATHTGGTRATLVAAPTRVTGLGSVDVDDAVLAHVRAVTAGEPGPVAADRDEATRLRAACAEVGARLRQEPAATVAWTSAGAPREVRVVAAELDDRLRPRAGRAMAAAADAVAAVAPGGVDRVLLTGRIAGMPLLTELVAERFEAPVTVLGEGTHAVARGAALLAGSPDPTAGPPHRAEPAEHRPHGRRARTGSSRRRPAGAAAAVGGGVVALGIAALAAWGAAVAGPASPADGALTTISPSGPTTAVGGPLPISGASGAGSTGRAAGGTGIGTATADAASALSTPPVLGPPPSASGAPGRGAAPVGPDRSSTPEQRGSAG